MTLLGSREHEYPSQGPEANGDEGFVRRFNVGLFLPDLEQRSDLALGWWPRGCHNKTEFLKQASDNRNE